MLSQLSVQNFALITSLHVNFESGLTTITGETGAGKSLLLGALGLIIGKAVGVFSFCYGVTRLVPSIRLPGNIHKLELLGVSLLCGIGFTMSLFIGSLAFGQLPGDMRVFDERVGILVGSTISALLGLSILYYSHLRPRQTS